MLSDEERLHLDTRHAAAEEKSDPVLWLLMKML